jgi:hypothetical protein
MKGHSDDGSHLLCSGIGRQLAVFIVPVPEAAIQIHELRPAEQERPDVNRQAIKSYEL